MQNKNMNIPKENKRRKNVRFMEKENGSGADRLD